MFVEEKKNSQTFQDSEDTFFPKSELEISDIIKNFAEKNTPLEIVGSGSKKFIGKKLQCAKTLNLSGLNGIIEYLPEELYIKVKACTPIEEIEKVLKEHNQQLAFEPIDFGFIVSGKSRKGTAAGCVSCNFSGSRRFKVGSVRDHVLGFRGINGKGEIIKSGGTVVKNVTGYDLSKLVSGSFGTLVTLTEITFKVLPLKASSSTLTIHDLDKKNVVQLFNKIAGSSNEVSGSVFLPLEPKNNKFQKNREDVFKFNDLKYEGNFLAIRMEGSKKSIEERKNALFQELELKKKKFSELDFYQSILFWKKINNLELFNSSKNSIIRIVIPPSKCLELINFFDDDFKYFIEWCGSLIWAEVCDLSDDKLSNIRKFVVERGGYLTLIKQTSDQLLNEIFTYTNARLHISKKIKESFDPKRILNPGKMYIGV